MPVYRWEQPDDTRRIDQLISMIVNSDVDAVSFTSAPAVASLLERAKAVGGALDCLIHALRHNVAVFCVGPVTASPPWPGSVSNRARRNGTGSARWPG